MPRIEGDKISLLLRALAEGKEDGVGPGRIVGGEKRPDRHVGLLILPLVGDEGAEQVLLPVQLPVERPEGEKAAGAQKDEKKEDTCAHQKKRPKIVPRMVIGVCSCYPFGRLLDLLHGDLRLAHEIPVLETRRELVDVLHRLLRFHVQAVVLDELAEGALALLDVRGDALQVGNHVLRVVIELVVLDELAEGALPFSHVLHDRVHLRHHRIGLVRHGPELDARLRDIRDDTVHLPLVLRYHILELRRSPLSCWRGSA